MENSHYIDSFELIHKALQDAKYPNADEKQFQVSCILARLIGSFEGLEDNFTWEQKNLILKTFESALTSNPFINNSNSNKNELSKN